MLVLNRYIVHVNTLYAYSEKSNVKLIKNAGVPAHIELTDIQKEKHG